MPIAKKVFKSFVSAVSSPQIPIADLYREAKSIYDEWKGVKWKGKRGKFEREHEGDLRAFHMTRRKLESTVPLPVKFSFRRGGRSWQRYNGSTPPSMSGTSLCVTN